MLRQYTQGVVIRSSRGAVNNIQFAGSSIEGRKCQDTGYRMDANARIQDEKMHRTEDIG